MGFFDTLRGKPQDAPKNVQNANQNNQQQQGNQGGPGTIPGGAGSSTTGSPSGNQSALDLHASLYDPPKAGSEDKGPPKFALAADKLDGVAKAQNFLQGHEELLAQVQGGDLSKLGELISAAARGAYRSSLDHGSTLTDKYVDARFGYSDSNFSSRVKGELAGNELASTPGFSNPVVRQQLNDVANRLRQQYPEAPPKEIAEEARRLLTEMSEAINPNSKKPTTGPMDGPGHALLGEEQDWAKYLDK